MQDNSMQFSDHIALTGIYLQAESSQLFDALLPIPTEVEALPNNTTQWKFVTGLEEKELTLYAGCRFKGKHAVFENHYCVVCNISDDYDFDKVDNDTIRKWISIAVFPSVATYLRESMAQQALRLGTEIPLVPLVLPGEWDFSEMEIVRFPIEDDSK